MTLRKAGAFFLSSLSVLAPTRAADVRVTDSPTLRRACAAAHPGDRITLAPGQYAPGVFIIGMNGAADHPIVIEGAPDDATVFDGGVEALHFSDCSHVVLRNVRCTRQTGNGINVDDGGHRESPSHHITLDNVTVDDTGDRTRGNHDPLKLSGVEDFVIRNCRITGWDGQAVDLVGCHRGLIEACTFTGKLGFVQGTGPQIKGGSSDVVVRRCTFDNAADRCVNVGGLTGTPYFRPPGAAYESRNITIEGCTFRGGQTPFAFVGVDGAVARYNTIVRPRKWLFRILQENRTPGFPPCRNVRLERNLFVWDHADCPVPVNIGDATAPETFTFADNLWYCTDAPPRSRVSLPGKQSGNRFDHDPRLKPGTSIPTDPAASMFGADALPRNK